MVWKALKTLVHYVHGFCTKLSLYETRSLYGTPLPPLPSFDWLYPLAFYILLPPPSLLPHQRRRRLRRRRLVGQSPVLTLAHHARAPDHVARRVGSAGPLAATAAAPLRVGAREGGDGGVARGRLLLLVVVVLQIIAKVKSFILALQELLSKGVSRCYNPLPPTCFALSRREAMELDIEGVFAAAAAAVYMAAP